METIAVVVPRPVNADSISASALFRIVEHGQPTLLIDEADVLLRTMPDAVQVLNSGYSRKGNVIRSVETKRNGTNGYEPRGFPTFAATVVAGIGETSPTLADRSIPIRLTRQLGNRPRPTITSKKLEDAGDKLRPHMAAYEDVIAKAMNAGVDDVSFRALGLASDRDVDNWEPLLAVARLIGDPWPSRCEQAALALTATTQVIGGPEAALADVWRAICEARRERVEQWREVKRGGNCIKSRGSLNFISSAEIVSRLLDHAGNFVGDKTEQQAKRAVARALRGFAVEPVLLRAHASMTGPTTPQRGYMVRAVRAAHRQYSGK